MRVSLALLAFPILAVATVIPRTDGDGEGACSTGPVQCCNTVAETYDSHVAEILGELGIDVGSLSGLVGLQCAPITILGLGGNTCTAQTVCCSNNTYNGLINIGCSPINIYL
ncbi:fruiting body protein SC1 [Schizophyllum amplum]|uniref:Hydrophobin n=1 Tax=Schizophyllum amplum TaxID=97359 RepID=A0A550CME5_9AGAR|nr:fruiting body protein SC1 [Auriculariopsis ampla]